jgi:hypothetical protein
MDVKTVNQPTPTPAQPVKRTSDQQPAAEANRRRVKDLEAQHTTRAFGNNEVINAQGHITGRHLNVTA